MIVNVDVTSVNIEIAGKSIYGAFSCEYGEWPLRIWTVVENHGDMEEKTVLRDIIQREKDKIPVVYVPQKAALLI